MPINPEAIGSRSDPTVTSWTSKDSLLYALGVGAGVDQLAYTTENSMNVTQVAVPTQVVTLADVTGAFGAIGSFNPAMLVHGEQRIKLHRPLPVAGSVRTVAEITGIFDKGKGAVIEVTAVSVDAESGDEMFTNVMSAFIRGEGGFGGDRGPSGVRNEAPSREPDASLTYVTSVDQALIYRLSGDRNPLHSDPSFASLAGFERPILHGLCTYGFTGRALVELTADGDPHALTAMEGRFSSPVYPGESLTINVWRGDGGWVFRTLGQDGRVVLDAGFVQTHGV